MGIGFVFHDFGKKFRLLIIIFYNLINAFFKKNLINANVENCGSFKSFGYIYIYIYIDNNNNNKCLKGGKSLGKQVVKKIK